MYFGENVHGWISLDVVWEATGLREADPETVAVQKLERVAECERGRGEENHQRLVREIWSPLCWLEH